MLTIKDLTASKELDREAMTGIAGGTRFDLFSPKSVPSFNEQIAATNALGGGASNVNNMINGGANYAGYGSQVVAPVIMNSSQSNDNDLTQTVIQAAIQSSFK